MGEIVVYAKNGNVKITHTNGPVWAHAGGSIDVWNLIGNSKLFAGREIRSESSFGDIDARAVGGNVSINNQRSGTVKAASGDGNISLNNPNADSEAAKAFSGGQIRTTPGITQVEYKVLRPEARAAGATNESQPGTEQIAARTGLTRCVLALLKMGK